MLPLLARGYGLCSFSYCSLQRVLGSRENCRYHKDRGRFKLCGVRGLVFPCGQLFCLHLPRSALYMDGYRGEWDDDAPTVSALFPFPNLKELHIHGCVAVPWALPLLRSCPGLQVLTNLSMRQSAVFAAEDLVDLSVFKKMWKIRLRLHGLETEDSDDQPLDDYHTHGGLPFHVGLSQLHVTHLQIGHSRPWLSDLEVVDGLLDLTFPSTLSHLDLHGVAPTRKSLLFVQRHGNQLLEVNVSFNVDMVRHSFNSAHYHLFIYDSIVRFIKTGVVDEHPVQFLDYQSPGDIGKPLEYSLGCRAFGYTLASVAPRIVTGVAIGLGGIRPMARAVHSKQILRVVVAQLSQFTSLQELVIQAFVEWHSTAGICTLDDALVRDLWFYYVPSPSDGDSLGLLCFPPLVAYTGAGMAPWKLPKPGRSACGQPVRRVVSKLLVVQDGATPRPRVWLWGAPSFHDGRHLADTPLQCSCRQEGDLTARATARGRRAIPIGYGWRRRGSHVRPREGGDGAPYVLRHACSCVGFASLPRVAVRGGGVGEHLILFATVCVVHPSSYSLVLLGCPPLPF